MVPKKKEDKKGKKKSTKKKVEELVVKESGLLNYGKLIPNEGLAYKPFEWGNFPMTKNGKPRGNTFKMRLPCDADWAGVESRVVKDDGEDKEDDILKFL